jgi:acyl-coenzyme A synthetase/AMP-(fatty) acid ligase
MENPDVGQDVIAVISLREGEGENGSAIETIRGHVIQNAPSYMVPKEILVREELPKTSSGKIDRKGISNAYANG